METTAARPAAYPSLGESFIIVGILLVMSVACGPLLMLGTWIGGELAMMIYYLTAFGLSFFIVHTLRKQKVGVSSYEFRIGSWRLVVPLALGSVGLLYGLIAPVQNVIPMPEWMLEAMRSVASTTGVPTFVYFVLAAPVLEELIFRGIMLDGLLKRYKPLVAIVVSSLLFGLVHLNPWQFVTGFVLGCFMGWVYYRTGSVSASIVIHMAANLSGYVLRLVVDIDAMFDQQAGVADAADGDFTQSVAVYVPMLIMFAISAYWLRREFNERDAAGQASAAGQ